MSVKTTDSHLFVSERFCKNEVLASAAEVFILILCVTMMASIGILLLPNKFKLMYNYNIVGLPDDFPIWVWAINYSQQIAMIYPVSFCYLVYTSLTMLIMNHSCYLVDSTLVYVEKLNDALNRGDDPPSHPLQWLSINRNLKKVAEMVGDIVKWQSDGQHLLKPKFLIVFGMHYTSLCLFIISLVDNSAEAFTTLIFGSIALAEFFLFCWMGSRVATKIETLTATLHGINWDRMVPKHRKDLLLVLLMCQNIKPYDGVFQPVDLPTFQAVSSSFPNNQVNFRFFNHSGP